jgi:peroxiredoxin
MKKFFIFILFIAAATVSGCENKASQVEGGVAPDFVLTDQEGKAQRLSEQRGKVVLIEFWATWCPPCGAAVPDLIALHAKYKERGLAVLAVSVDEDGSALPPFIAEKGINYPVLHDDKNVSSIYKISSIPTTFLIDKQGNIVKRHFGYVSGMSETLSKEIESLL